MEIAQKTKSGSQESWKSVIRKIVATSAGMSGILFKIQILKGSSYVAVLQ